MHAPRRSVLGTGGALLAGLTGCSHVAPGPSTPEAVGKVYVAEDVLSIEARGATLYGQIHADGIEESSPDGPGRFDPKTGSFSLSGESRISVEFQPGTLESLTVLSRDGVFDMFARGELVERQTHRATVGPEGEVDAQPRVPSTPAKSDGDGRIYISQRAILFELHGVSTSGQVSAADLEGADLEAGDELDTTAGGFELHGEGRDLIRFTSGSLRALSVLVDEGTVDVFYRGKILDSSVDRFSSQFTPRARPPSPSVIDDFEDGSMDEYVIDHVGVVDNPNFSTDPSFEVQESAVKQGRRALRSVGQTFWRDDVRTRPGERYRAWLKFGSPGADFGLALAVQDASTHESWYTADVLNAGSTVRLLKRVEGETTKLAKTDGPRAVDEWVELEMTWDFDGRITASLIEESGESIATVTGRDTTFDGGGVGLRNGGRFPVYTDYVRRFAA
jgi:hypothetical protein